jgi:hypothetical protein
MIRYKECFLKGVHYCRNQYFTSSSPLMLFLSTTNHLSKEKCQHFVKVPLELMSKGFEETLRLSLDLDAESEIASKQNETTLY